MSLKPSHPDIHLNQALLHPVLHLKMGEELSEAFKKLTVEETETKSQGVSCSLDGWIVLKWFKWAVFIYVFYIFACLKTICIWIVFALYLSCRSNSFIDLYKVCFKKLMRELQLEWLESCLKWLKRAVFVYILICLYFLFISSVFALYVYCISYRCTNLQYIC